MIGRFPLKTVIKFIPRNEGKGMLSEKSHVKGKLTKIFDCKETNKNLKKLEKGRQLSATFA